MQLRKKRFGKIRAMSKRGGAMAALASRGLRLAAWGAVVGLLMAHPAAAQSPQVAPPEKTQAVAPSAASAPTAPRQSTDAAARKKQLEEAGAHLLQLANELKAEVGKTNKDVLSMSVVRKAEEIERMARGMKEKAKTTGGAE